MALRFLFSVLTLAAFLPFARAQAAGETLAERTLREIVARERALFARADQEGEHLDEPRFAADAKAIAASYDVLLQKNPDWVPLLVTYGMFLSKIDMNRAAAAMLLKANKLEPNLALVKNQLAKLLAEDGKPLEALPYLVSAVDLEPNEPLYHLHLGKLLLEARDDFVRSGEWQRPALEKAMLDALQRAADLAAGDFSYAYQHAKAYYELDPPRWEEALAVWEKLGRRATTEPTRQLVKLHRANVLVQLGRLDDARTLLDEVTDLQLVAEKQQVIDAITAKQAPAGSPTRE